MVKEQYLIVMQIQNIQFGQASRAAYFMDSIGERWDKMLKISVQDNVAQNM